MPQPDRNHILADENIGALLWRLSIPAMVGMGVMASYNLVDAIFIGRGVGTLGIAGLAICFPVQLINLAIGQMIGMGAASIISRALGAGDEARGHRAFGNALFMVVVLAVVLTTGGLLFIEQLLRVFGATKEILPYAREYLSIILWGTAFRFYAMSHNNIIRSEGRAKIAMTVMIIGAGVNIVLDPVFIFGLGMGMRGAALATLLAQACTTTFIVSYFKSGRSSLSMGPKDFLPSWPIIRETLAVGASSFARMVAGSAVVVILNRTLGHYGGNLAIAAYGVLNRLMHFAFMPMMGFSQALQPVAGFNYGARQFARARLALRISSIRSTVFAVGALVMLIGFGRPLIQLFTRDAELIELSVRALRIIAVAFPVVAVQVMGATMFLALGRAGPALFLSLSRQIIFLIPLVLLLPLTMGLTGIFVAFPIADVLATVVTVVMLAREFRRLRGLEAEAALA
ncbi:MAG TPA: MATE family efflux transporter [bacterium]|nr:MATE family efflux transporter [bacterium]